MGSMGYGIMGEDYTDKPSISHNENNSQTEHELVTWKKRKQFKTVLLYRLEEDTFWIIKDSLVIHSSCATQRTFIPRN